MNHFMPKNFEEVEEVKERLKQCKTEWLETKPGKGNTTYMSHNTIRQILDAAVKGITYWDFTITEQWKEEIFSTPKGGQPYFDGYVYHVKGSMYIPGVGRREQYGSKVAVGGKENQDSAYKAAASNCFNKCASLFGVGAEIYDKIKVEDEVNQQQEPYNQQQNMQGFQNNQGFNQQQQQYGQQQQFNQQQYNQQQFNQQNNQQQYQNQYQQQPQQNNFQQQQGFQNNNAFGGQAGNFNQGQQQQQQNQAQEPVVDRTIEQDMLDIDRKIYNGEHIETPFDGVQPRSEAQVNTHQAEEQQTVTPNDYQVQTVEYGAPVTPEEKAEEKVEEKPKPATENTEGTNPWQEQGVIQELQAYAAHKQRLNAESDEQMIAYLRDYFKDEKATFDYLSPENIQGFNQYLNNISA